MRQQIQEWIRRHRNVIGWNGKSCVFNEGEIKAAEYSTLSAHTLFPFSTSDKGHNFPPFGFFVPPPLHSTSLSVAGGEDVLMFPSKKSSPGGPN